MTTKIDLDDATNKVENAVYAACSGIYESLEHAGHIRGNGHHMAQEMAKKAVDLMRERWISNPTKTQQ